MRAHLLPATRPRPGQASPAPARRAGARPHDRHRRPLTSFPVDADPFAVDEADLPPWSGSRLIDVGFDEVGQDLAEFGRHRWDPDLAEDA